jgi:hypothetical protein
MTQNFVLIDFENVQCKHVGTLQPGACRIKIFVGANQSKLLLQLVQALQPFGSDVEYIQITGSGPNALDFHIAFYIGHLATLHPQATFTIVSKDSGFDPLIKHLAGLKIACKRVAAIATNINSAAKAKSGNAEAKKAGAAATSKPGRNVTVTVLSEPNGKASVVSSPARAAEVVSRLKGLKTARPARLATLKSSIKSWFKPALDQKQVTDVIQSLIDAKQIAVEGVKVAYRLG